jgi:hypothetical protein
MWFRIISTKTRSPSSGDGVRAEEEIKVERSWRGMWEEGVGDVTMITRN